MSSLEYFLRHEELPQGVDPMGESLLTQKNSPFKVWIPDSLGAVLGNSQKAEKELNLEQCLKDELPIYKRRGGGGTVLLSPKGLCFGIRFKKNKDWAIHDYFNHGTGVLQSVLKAEFGIDAAQRGISDLCIGQKKILGCSLYLPKYFGLYLASVLIEPDIENIEKYLAHPSLEPDYRKGRTHRDFLTFISEETQGNANGQKLKNLLEKQILTDLGDFLDFFHEE